MKTKALILFLFLLAALPAFAQTTSVSGTIADSNGQAFNNGTWSAKLIGPPGYSGVFFSAGVQLTQAQTNQSGSLSSAGAISLTVVPNNLITITGGPSNATQWQFTSCPASSSNCYTNALTITGSTYSVTGNIVAPPITVYAVANIILAAYTDAEVTGPVEGSTYWNITSAALRTYHSGAWVTSGGGGGSGVTSVTGTSPISVATGTTTPVISLNGAAVPSVFTATSPFIDPRNTAYGSCKGDGTDTSTAATACWQAAEAAMQASGGSIICVAGTSWTLNRVQVNNFDTIRGTGDASETGCQITPATDAAFVQANPTSVENLITITDISFTGGSYVIDFPLVNGMDLERLVFYNYSECAISLVGGERHTIKEITTAHTSVNGLATLCTGNYHNSLFAASLSQANSNGSARTVVEHMHEFGSLTAAGFSEQWLWLGSANTNVGDGTGPVSDNAVTDITCGYSCTTGVMQFGNVYNSIFNIVDTDHVATSGSPEAIGINIVGAFQSSHIFAYTPAFNTNSMTENMFIGFMGGGGDVKPSTIEDCIFNPSADNVSTFGLVFGSGSPSLQIGALIGISGAVYTQGAPASYQFSIIGSNITPTNLPSNGSGQFVSLYDNNSLFVGTTISNNSFFTNPSNGNAALTPIASVEFHNGRNSSGGLGGGDINADIAFQWAGSGGGLRNWITSWHAAASTGSQLNFYINTSSSVGGSSAPGTGNTLGLTIGTTGITTPGVTDSALTSGDCVQAGTGGILTSASSACGSGGGTPAFPITVTGGVSGAVPCFTSTTVEAAGTLLPAGDFVLGGGAGVCPTATFSLVPVANGGTGLATQTSNVIYKGNGTSAEAVSSLSDNGTTVSTSEPASFGASVSTTSDGTHPSSVQLAGNTTLPTLTTNTVTILGPPSATPTAWSLQVPTAIPATTDLFSCVVTGTNCLLTDTGIPATAAGFNTTIATLTGCSTATYVYTPQAADCVAPSAASLSFPLTVSGTTTSGGIPYFSSTTALTSSALLASNGIVLGGGAGTAPKTTADITTDGTSKITLGASGTAGDFIVYPASGNFTTTWGSAATASNTILGFAAVPVTTDIIDCVVSSTTCTLTDSGITVANVVTPSSTNTFTNKSISLAQINSGLTSGGVFCATSTTVPAFTAALTVNVMPKGGGAGACPTNSTVTDNGTTVSTTEPFAATSVATGTSPPTCAVGTGGAICENEGTAATAVAAVDDLHADSTAHAEMVNNNNTGEMVLSRVPCANATVTTVAASSTTFQLLGACTLAANTMNVVGHTLKVFMAGVYSNVVTSAPTVTLGVKLCTVSGCGSGTVISPCSIVSTATSATAVTNLAANLTCNIMTQTAGASSAYEAHGNMAIDLGATNLVADSVFADTNTATVGTIDSTGQLFLQLFVTFSAASTSNSFSERELVVELVN
jgi:hypothetical protein